MAIKMDTKPPWMIKIHSGIWQRMELLLQGLLTSPSVVVRKRPRIGVKGQMIIQTTHAMLKKKWQHNYDGDFSLIFFPVFLSYPEFIFAIFQSLLYFSNVGLS